MRKLILKNGYSPGDIVMMTAAVRDLHLCYPNQFLTDVRTSCADLWENNPYLTRVDDDDSEAELIDCAYPLINWCNERPYHCLHGYIEFLNDRLDLAIKPTAFKGDIHLSEKEKRWASQVHEVTGEDTPFWIIGAGGKYDIPIKWWATERYQEVVDHFRHKIQFVQVGAVGHYHPKLSGVIDLRGQTSLRELVRLVHHSQGVLCGITALMHLSAAVEMKGTTGNRPCVVVAGGREPAHWEAYLDHQFIHTNGALACCSHGGCWKDRVLPLGDGDKRDRADHCCVDVVGSLPRCMHMITSAEVIRRIEMFVTGGVAKYMTRTQAKAAEKGVIATASNPFDSLALNLHNARMACEAFIQSIPAYAGASNGRGIVICGGSVRYFTNAWVCIHRLRQSGCTLPIELWYMGDKECDREMRKLITPLKVRCVDALRVRQKYPARLLRGWELKPYAILYSRFREVLLLDADNLAVKNPEFLFESRQFRDTGAIFWPDYGRDQKANAIWKSCGISRPKEPEFETGQIVVDKERCWRALRLCLWFNENSDFYYQYLHGDKETFHLAFRKMQKSYSLVSTPIHSLEATMCQHDFAGDRLFQHRNMDKWNLFARNRRVKDFWFEEECRKDLARLRMLWDGRAGEYRTRNPQRLSHGRSMNVAAFLLNGHSSAEPHTSQNLLGTDWGEKPTLISVDTDESDEQSFPEALRQCLDCAADYLLLLLRDDLTFNMYLRHNLSCWRPLKEHCINVAGLFNSQLRELAYDVEHNLIVVNPRSIFNAPALLFSRPAASYFIRQWKRLQGQRDARIAELATRRHQPVYYHTPSLVQDLSVSEGRKRISAIDFSPDWKA